VFPALLFVNTEFACSLYRGECEEGTDVTSRKLQITKTKLNADCRMWQCF